MNAVVHRTICLSKNSKLSVELDHVSLLISGYKNQEFQGVIERRFNSPTTNNNMSLIHLLLFPYVSSITDWIGRLLLKHKVQPIFRSSPKISQMLSS